MNASRRDTPPPDDARSAIDALDALLGSMIGDDRPVDALATIRAVGHVLEVRSSEAAKAAIDGTSSWADVGDALGISRQAAHQRLGTKLDRKVAHVREKLESRARE